MKIDSDFQSECITCETNDTQYGYTQNTSDMSMQDSKTNSEITLCSNLSENCSDVFDNSHTENIIEAQGMSNILNQIQLFICRHLLTIYKQVYLKKAGLIIKF